MCGIVGCVFAGPAEWVDGEAALRVLHNRGPDSRGLIRLEGAVFGHTRLAVLDLSEAGQQPMRTGDGRYVIVFNGEIYNHSDLREDLARRGVRFRSRTDTEVILEGYRALGESFLRRLDGMFAFGIYDSVEKTLVLMRDRMGKKPLFYAADARGFRFASTIRALFASGLPVRVDVARMPLLLSLGYVPGPDTLYEGVKQLPPATILRVERGKEPLASTYWSTNFAEIPRRVSVGEALERVRDLTLRAVRRRVEADVPLGAFLSGGLDSTIIVGLMARARSDRVKTFSIGFEGDERFDETEFASLAAAAFGTDHTEFVVKPSSFELVDRLVEAHDGPFGDSSAIPTSIVSQLTKAYVTVALTGDGGDELFCGYPRMMGAELAEYVPSWSLRAASRALAVLPEATSPRAPSRRMRRLVRTMASPLPERMLRWQSFFVEGMSRLVKPELALASRESDASRWMSDVAAGCRARSPLAAALCLNFRTYLPYDLLVKADRSSMLHGLEVRSPFLDTELVEYVTSLPDHMKRRGLTTKWILRKAFADLVPAPILRRKKMGFGVPMGSWFRTGLRAYVQDTLGPSARLFTYLERDTVQQLLGEHDQGRNDHEYQIWLLLTIERWLQLLPSWSAPT